MKSFLQGFAGWFAAALLLAGTYAAAQVAGWTLSPDTLTLSTNSNVDIGQSATTSPPRVRIGTLAHNSTFLVNGGAVAALAPVTGLVLGNGSNAPAAYTGTTAGTHQFVTALNGSGTGSFAQPSCSYLSDALASCNTLGASFIPSTFPNPIGTISITCVMMGLGATATITPATSGRVLVIFNGKFSNDTSGDGYGYGLKYGIGAAPINGAALTGTNVGGPACGDFGGIVATGGIGQMGSFIGVLTGLTVGTPYWIDLAMAAVTGGTASVTKVQLIAIEF